MRHRISRTNFEIAVPDNLTDKALVGFFQGWRWVTDIRLPVVIDFKTCNYIAPYAVTLFATYILWLKEAAHRRVTVLADTKTVAGNYLVQTGLLELVGDAAHPPTDSRPDRMVRLTRIRSSKEIPDFATNLMTILALEDEELAGAVKYSLIELLRNVVQHASSAVGGLAMAQYYPTTGLVEVCVADAGLGIKATINEAYPEIDSHLKALKFATQPHVSRTFGPANYSAMRDNAGLGLFFIKQIASLSGGSFFLVSRDALVDIWGDKEGVQWKLYRVARTPGWPGTFAYLQLRRDTISEFDAVLTKCRELAAIAQKYPSELALDFIEGLPEGDNAIVVRVQAFEEDVETAAEVRDRTIIPNIRSGRLVVIDFGGVKFATQSFVHALMYKVIRDGQLIGATLCIANCTNATRQAVTAVAAYAKAGHDDEGQRK